MIGFKREFGENARQISLLLNDIEKTKMFNAMDTQIDGDLTFVSAKYVIDGKSLMGMYTLDLSKEVRVIVECETAAKSEEAIAAFKKAFA